MKVLFIVGNGRSGSTILGDLLGTVAGFSHVGELRHIWIRGLDEDWLCGCGAEVRRCELWKSVVSNVFGGLSRESSRELAWRQETLHRRLLFRPDARTDRDIHEFSDLLPRIYRSIQIEQNARIIVDSSKHPSHANLALRGLGDKALLVHLVRDPRAVAFSWRRRVQHRASPTPFVMYRDGVRESVDAWLGRNEAVERLIRQSGARSMRLRYEDFAAKPAETIEQVLDFAGETGALPEFSDGKIELDSSHVVSGSPSRMLRPPRVSISVDNSWRDAMDPDERDLVTVSTRHLLVRYGYSID